MQLTDWLLVEVSLLFIGLTHIAFDTKTSFDHLGRQKQNALAPLDARDTNPCTISTIVDEM